MKHLSIAPSLLGVMALLTGCAHSYYAPNSANIPMLKEKNTFIGKGGYASSPDPYTSGYNGADIQLAYSTGKNTAVMLNSFFAGKSEDVQDELNSSASHQESGKGSYVEAGVGYYKPFGKEKQWVFETYGGAGIGGENHTYYLSETAKLNLSKFFIQPSIGYSSRHIEVAFGSRFSSLNLKVKESNLQSGHSESEKGNLDAIAAHPSTFLWEPSLMIAAGWQNFKFYLQTTSSKNLNNQDFETYVEPSNISIGIKFKLGKSQAKGNTKADSPLAFID